MATKKEVTKAAEKAEMTKASTEDKVTEKKTDTKKATAKKTTAKKTTTKKTSAKKEMKVATVIQYYGKEVEEKEIIAAVKKAWTKAGNKVGDIQTMELYIKPEDGAVYYVINGSEGGAVAF